MLRLSHKNLTQVHLSEYTNKCKQMYTKLYLMVIYEKKNIIFSVLLN
jgi:hypothetical protein